MGEKIAFIGLGQMGGAMAARLIEVGFDVSGFDISADARQRLVDAGGTAAESIAQAIKGRSVIMTSLPDPNVVRSAFLADDGIVPLAVAGSLLVDLSTIDPETIRDVERAAVKRGLKVIDAPVSGSPKDSRAGTLVMMVGGAPADVKQAEPYLAALSSGRHVTGGVGTAKVVKIVNNMMAMGNVLIASEAFVLGTAAGVEPQLLYDVLSVSGGRSHHFVNRFKNALKGNFEPGFKIWLGEKDLALGVDLGRAMKVPTPAASTVRDMFALALAEGFRDKDIVALLQMYQGWSSHSKQ